MEAKLLLKLNIKNFYPIIIVLIAFLSLNKISLAQSQPDVVEKTYSANNWGVSTVKTAGLYTGESVDLSSMELSWNSIDVSIPGNIPIQIGRTYTNFDSPFAAWAPNIIDARWDLDIPSIRFGVWANGLGRMSACMNNSGLQKIKNYNIIIPGAGKFREIGRNPAISYPPNTVTQFENNWLLICETFTTRSNSKDVNGNPQGQARPWGVTLLSPSGLKYRFAFYSAWQPFNWSPQYLASIGLRKPILRNFELRVTDIEDQFGNYLAFDYEEFNLNNNHRLLRPKSIRANDGRRVDFFYESNSGNTLYQSHQLTKIKYGSYEVNYDYTNNKLSRVRLPEGLTWDFTYQSAALEYLRELKSVKTPSGASIEYSYTDESEVLACDSIKDLATNLTQRKLIDGSNTYTYNYSLSDTVVNFSSTVRVSGPKATQEQTTVCIPIGRENLPLRNYISGTRSGYLDSGGNFIVTRQTEYDWRSIQHGTTMDLGGWNDRASDREYLKSTTIDSNYSQTNNSLDHFGNPQSIYETGVGIARTRNISYWNNSSRWLVGKKTNETVSNKYTESNLFDSYGRLTRSTVNGVTKNFTYSGANLASETDAVGNQTQYRNYYLGKPRLIELPRGQVTYTYDNFGRVKSFTNERSYTSSYNWDNQGRLTLINEPIGADIAISYLNNSQIIVNRGSLRETIDLDGLNRTKRVTLRDLNTGTQRFTRFTYDDRGNQTFVSLPSYNANETKGVRSTFDELDRLVKEISPTGTTLISYPTSTQQVITKANGRTVTRNYQAYADPNKALLVQSIDQVSASNSITTSITRDLVGRLTKVQQGGHDINYQYHPTFKDFVNSISYPSHTENYEPDSNGRVSTKRYGSGQKIRFSYDFRNNPRSINYPDNTPDETFSYSLTGNLQTASNGISSWSYQYDDLDRLTNEKLTLDGTSYSTSYRYNNQGHLIETNFPSGNRVYYTPNSFGETQAISGALNNVQYFADGGISTINYSNGIRTSFTRQSNGVNLASMIGKKGNTTRFGYSYTYDNLRNLKSINNTTNASYSISNIQYDGLERLLSATSPSMGGTIQYTYDDLGNIQSKSLGTTNWNYRYNSSNNLLTRIDGSNYQFAYDNRGNVTSNGRRAFSYNLANQMVNSQGKQFNYDAHGKRVKADNEISIYSLSGALIHRVKGSKFTDYIYLGNKLVAKNQFGTKNKVIIIPYKDLVITVKLPKSTTDTSSKSVTYVHSDFLGSPIANSDSSGNITQRYYYQPFGKNINISTDDIGYTGHKFDADLGLNYMQARYYDPDVGRFYSNDPVGFKDIHSFNRYTYANNNPYKYIDPDGKTSWPVDKNINGQVVITSPFGLRFTGIARASTNHSGTDFRAKRGADIRATENGIVKKIGSSGRAGNYILISNTDGSMSGHAHTAATPGLKVGDKVKEGSVIGTSDGSGTGNAPHQHYTYRIGTQKKPATQSTPKVDPMTTQFKNKPQKEICIKTQLNKC